MGVQLEFFPAPHRVHRVERYYLRVRCDTVRPERVSLKEVMRRYWYARARITELKQRIRLWKDDEAGSDYINHRTLTDLAWEVAPRVHMLGFRDHRQELFLLWGFLELCKILADEVDEERKYCRPVVAPREPRAHQ